MDEKRFVKRTIKLEWSIPSGPNNESSMSTSRT